MPVYKWFSGLGSVIGDRAPYHMQMVSLCAASDFRSGVA